MTNLTADITVFTSESKIAEMTVALDRLSNETAMNTELPTLALFMEGTWQHGSTSFCAVRAQCPQGWHRRELDAYLLVQAPGGDLLDLMMLQVVKQIIVECHHQHPVAKFQAPTTPWAAGPIPSISTKWATFSSIDLSAMPGWPGNLSGTMVCSALKTAFPALGEARLDYCPAGCTTAALPSDIFKMIPHLNDHHDWTREQIADWLDTLDIDQTIKIPTKEDKRADHDDTTHP